MRKLISGLRLTCCPLLLGAILVAAGVHHAGLTAAEPSYRHLDNWPETLPTVPMAFVSWVDVDSKGQTYVFRRCPIKCSDNPHPGAGDPPGSVLLFDANGKYLREWEPKSGGKAKEAHSLHLDRHGFIW